MERRHWQGNEQFFKLTYVAYTFTHCLNPRPIRNWPRYKISAIFHLPGAVSSLVKTVSSVKDCSMWCLIKDRFENFAHHKASLI